MARMSAMQHQDRSTYGGTVSRVLLIILGSILVICGLIMAIATIAISLDEDATILVILPFVISSCVGGIYIIASQVSRGTNTDNPQLKNREQVVSATPITALPQEVQERERTSTPLPDAQKAPTSQPDDISHLVFRSTDLFATLRDLARHHASSDGSRDKRHLASMLEASGIMEWQDAPACEGGRLSRNEHYWIRLATDNLDERQYDTLIAAEAALGVNQDLPGVRTKDVASTEAREACLRLMRTMCEQRIEKAKLVTEGIRACYHTEDSTVTPQDFVVRASVCNAAECLRTPFRVVYDVRVNIADGLVVLSIEAPRPACMAIFAPDTATQAGLARAYAFRLAVLLAQHAFDASDDVVRVVANCHEHDSADTLVSLDIDRKLISSLLKVASGSTIETGFPADERIRAVFSSGWFKPVEPFVSLTSREAQPAEATIFPELDERPASEAIARTCHAKRICDLGINENAARIAAWNEVREQLGTTTEQAVSSLKTVRDAASDITVAEACNRTMQALVNGEVDLDDLGALSRLFIDGSALDRAVQRAAEFLADDGHEDPEAAFKILDAALAPIDDMGVYLDDATTVYRYFGSVSERIHHNNAIDEAGREIRLVPDAYFNAHSNASIALGLMGKNEAALAHAEVCLRLAPTSTYATMRKVRILEAQSRIFEAADLIVAALRHAVTPRDAAICHYRLAYMEWKLGREDLAAACYVRSLTWDTEMSAQAREELDDLISSSPNLERPTSEQAEALLAREGIPLGCVRTDSERTLAAAVACMDSGALLSARPLMAALFGMNGDDVVMGVYRSLSVSV